MWGSRSLAMTIGAAAFVAACGDLEQAATGAGGGDGDTSDGSVATDMPTATTGDEAGDAQGTAASATSGVGTGPPGDDSGTSVAVDDTSASDSSSDGGSTDGGIPPLDGPHDGVYSGTVSAEFNVGGETGTCTGAMTLTVDDAIDPHITGTGACGVVIDGYPFDVVMSIEGSVISPTASGTLSAVINFTNESSTWSGAFAGDVMDATFAGDFPQGPYTVTYTGSWSITR